LEPTWFFSKYGFSGGLGENKKGRTNIVERGGGL